MAYGTSTYEEALLLGMDPKWMMPCRTHGLIYVCPSVCLSVRTYVRPSVRLSHPRGLEGLRGPQIPSEGPQRGSEALRRPSGSFRGPFLPPEAPRKPPKSILGLQGAYEDLREPYKVQEEAIKRPRRPGKGKTDGWTEIMPCILQDIIHFGS